MPVTQPCHVHTNPIKLPETSANEPMNLLSSYLSLLFCNLEQWNRICSTVSISSQSVHKSDDSDPAILPIIKYPAIIPVVVLTETLLLPSTELKLVFFSTGPNVLVSLQSFLFLLARLVPFRKHLLIFPRQEPRRGLTAPTQPGSSIFMPTLPISSAVSLPVKLKLPGSQHGLQNVLSLTNHLWPLN